MKLHEIALTPPIAAIIILLTLTASAAPKVVYVATDGTGDGIGGWENATASIGDAYASAAAFAEGGCDSGEVWIKTGRYYLPALITLASHVEVIGGFAGNETMSSAADPEANPVIISGEKAKNTNQWLYPGQGIPTPRCYCWTGEDRMTFVYPDTIGEDGYWQKYGYWQPYGGGADTTYAFYSSDNADLEGAVIRGVTLTGFYSGAICVTKGSNHALTVVDCRLLSNTTRIANYESFTVTDAGVAVTNIEYCGNWRPLRVVTTTASAGRTIPASFYKCKIFENHGSFGVSAVKGGASLDLTVDKCTFESSSGGVSLSLSQPCSVRMMDCDFIDLRIRSRADGALVLGGSSASSVNIDRCRFLRNNLVVSEVTGNLCAGLFHSLPDTNARYDSCYFGGNFAVIENASEGSYCASAVLLANANNYNAFVNCTFETNSVASTGALGHAGTFVIASAAARSGWANCTFVNNSATGSALHKADVSGWPGWQTSMAFYNTLFVNPAADYRVMDIVDNWTGVSYFTPSFWRCAASRWDFSETGLTKIGGNPILTDGVDIAAASAAGPNGAIARGVAVSAARDIRKTGFALWSAASGYDVVIRNPEADKSKPWRFLGLSNKNTYSDADAAALGYSVDNPPFPDAFGADRTIGKIAYGPLNAPVSGLMLLVR